MQRIRLHQQPPELHAIDLHPQRYGEHHLRTLQRRLRGYRLQWIEREMAAAATAPIPGMQRSETGEMPVLPGVN